MTPEALVASAKWEASLFEEHGFHDFGISVKHNDPVIMVDAYRQLSAEGRLAAAPGRHRGRPRGREEQGPREEARGTRLQVNPSGKLDIALPLRGRAQVDDKGTRHRGARTRSPAGP